MHVTETIVISACFIYLIANLTKKSTVFTPPQLIFVKFTNFCSMVFINPNRTIGRICKNFSTAWCLSVFIRHLLLVFNSQ